MGVNTLLLSASSTPVPDIVALGATATKDGIVHLVGGAGAFAIATSNVGSAGSITFSSDTEGVNVPVALSVFETNPSTGACLALPTPTVTTTIGAGRRPPSPSSPARVAPSRWTRKTIAYSAGSRTVAACPVGRPAWQ